MSRMVLVRGARQLLTLQGPSGPRRGADLRNLRIIEDGAVLIADGLIREVGPTRRLDNLAESRQALEINATGKVILPGFVDSHTHLVSGPSRLGDFEMQLAGATYDEIARAGGGLPAIFKAMQDVPLRRLEAQATRVVQDAIRQGTTTLEAKCGYGLSETGELKILRTHAALNRRFDHVVSTFMAASFIPQLRQTQADEYLEWLCSHMLPLVHRRKLAAFVDISCEEETFSLQQSRRLLTAAKKIGFGIKLHAGQHWNLGGIPLAVELEATSVDHGIYIDHKDVDLLAASKTICTLLPGTVLYLGSQRYAAARNLIDRGAAVALATNYNPITSPSHNMQMIVALACRKMGMTPAEAISAATINGAYAVGQGDQTGSIECGKYADLLVLGVPDYREIPYHFGVNLVETTMKRGEVIYRASEVQWPTS